MGRRIGSTLRNLDHPWKFWPLINKVRNCHPCHPPPWFISYLLIMRFMLILQRDIIQKKKKKGNLQRAHPSGVLHMCLLLGVRPSLHMGRLKEWMFQTDVKAAKMISVLWTQTTPTTQNGLSSPGSQLNMVNGLRQMKYLILCSTS